LDTSAGNHRPVTMARRTEPVSNVHPLPTASVAEPDEAFELVRSFFPKSGTRMAKLDRYGRIERVSSPLVRQFGRPATEMHGRMFEEFLRPEDRETFRTHFGAVRAGARPYWSDVVTVRGLGPRVFSCRVTAIGVRRGSDRVDTVVVVLSAKRSGHLFALTASNARVLEGVAAGASTADLAAQMHLSPQGIEYHVASLLRRVNAPNRPALVARAYALGILTPGRWPPRVSAEALM
jgi:DNA-binding CsgD family transcriptional regulator